MKGSVLGVSFAVLTLVSLSAEQSNLSDTADLILDVAAKGTGSLGVPNSASSIEPSALVGLDRTVSKGNNRDRLATLSLVRLEREVFNWGDLFTYDVLIENSGRQPIDIPWSSDESLAETAHAAVLREFQNGNVALKGHPFRSGRVGLDVYSIDGKQLLGGLEVLPLVGSESYPGTLYRLAPGKRVILRMYGRWNTTDMNAVEKMVAQPEGRVRLVPVLYLPDDGVFQKGANSITTTVLYEAY